MKKVFRKFHLWLSIPFGIIISIICFSGAALVFETEIMELCYPNRYFVKKVQEKAIPMEQLLLTVSKTLPDTTTITSISIPSDPRRAYQIGLSKPRRAGVYIDPYTGEVKERYERAAFFAFMVRLHRWLLDSMKPGGELSVGKTVVGISTLLFVIIMITGIIIWIPRTKKALNTRLKISIRNGWTRFWYDLHVVGGIYAVVVLLVLGLTGLTWSFTWYRTGFYKLFGVEVQQQAPRGQSEQRGERQKRDDKTVLQTNFANWQQVYDQLNTQNPDNNQISISDGSANVSFNKMGNQRASDRYTFDPATGNITNATLYKDLDKSGKIRGWIYSVHVGSWGGMFTKIVTFFAAFTGGMLPITGYYLWVKRTFRKRKKTGKVLQPKN